MELKPHPYADLFPMMTDDEIKELADDIKKNGQLEDIVVVDNMILDGRNRYRACMLAGVEPLKRGLLDGDPLTFVLSKNLHRRHLSTSQRAMVAANIATLGQGKPANLPDKVPTQAEAAKLLNVSERSVRDARAVRDGSPDLVKAVQAGEMTVSKAAKIVKQPEPQKDKDQEAVQSGPVKISGVGTIRANEAINCLSRIPRDDALRIAGFKMVTDWIKREDVATPKPVNEPTFTPPRKVNIYGLIAMVLKQAKRKKENVDFFIRELKNGIQQLEAIKNKAAQ